MYFSRQFTFRAAGRQTKHVTCEKCQTRFCYELTRTSTGTGEAPYLVGQADAAARAQAAARRRLDKRLEREAELVPCPRCGWVNEDLVRTYRRQKYWHLPWLSAVIVPTGILAALLLGAGLRSVFGRHSEVAATARLIVLVPCLLSPIWIFPVRSWLRRRIDPNQTYPQRPVVPLGTPPALIERNDPYTGEGHLEPVPNRYENSDLLADWAVFRPGQVVFPEACCCCMAPASTQYGAPFKVNQNSEMVVPLCGPCSSRVRRRWWTAALAVTGVVLASAALLAREVPGIDLASRWIIFCVVAVFAVPFAVAILPNLFCRPYRLRVIDADRTILAFRAPSRAFTELLINQVRQSDGHA